MRIVFLGHGKWACLVLQMLLCEGHDVPAVITETDRFEERRAVDNRRLARYGAYESLKEYAAAVGIVVQQPENFHAPEFLAWLDALAPELFVCVSYHTIFKQPFLTRHLGHVINVHLAPLPFYRGRAPLNWAILNNETSTAVTVHYIEAGIDTGPVIVQRPVPIGSDDYAVDVLLRSLPEFPNAVRVALERLNDPAFRSTPQDPSVGSYYGRRSAEDGVIDWEAESTLAIYNKVRALADPYPGAFSFQGRDRIVFQRASAMRHRTELRPGTIIGASPDVPLSVLVSTIDGMLRVDRIGEDDAQQEPGTSLRAGMVLRATPPPPNHSTGSS